MENYRFLNVDTDKEVNEEKVKYDEKMNLFNAQLEKLKEKLTTESCLGTSPPVSK